MLVAPKCWATLSVAQHLVAIGLDSPVIVLSARYIYRQLHDMLYRIFLEEVMSCIVAGVSRSNAVI